MDVVRPEFVPDPSLSRAGMESLQREIAAAATFEDDLDLGETAAVGTGSGPPVAGVDQAFDIGGEDGDRDGDDGTGDDGTGDEAVSGAVLTRGERVLEQTGARRPAAIPYIPGLLSFR